MKSQNYEIHIRPFQFNLLFYERIQINQMVARSAKKQLQQQQKSFNKDFFRTSGFAVL